MKENLKMIIKNSYAPYSNFNVACIVKMNDGQEFLGVNVENASFKNGLCAEQVAIASAIAEGYKNGDFAEIHIMGDSKKVSYPCFLCRQLLVEFFKPESKVICYNINGKKEEFLVSELCPHVYSLEEVKNG
ncbi:MAG: cytidine deaminase [Mollicutes bacterium]|nr:cytidine deaminase [Mollicutes bacterium]